MFGAGATNSFSLPGSTGPSGPVSVGWRFDDATAATAPSAATADTVFVGSEDANVYALDAATGAERWRFEEASNRTVPTAVVDGTLYAGSEARPGHLYALDASTGDERWRSPELDQAIGPAVVGNRVYVGGDASLAALDAATGEVAWEFAEPTRPTFEPTAVGDTVYTGGMDGKVFALDAATGDVRWRFDRGTDNWKSPPAAVEGSVYVGSKSGAVWALDAATGESEWSLHEVSTEMTSPPTVHDGAVLFSAGSEVFRLNGDSGEVEWRFEAEDKLVWPALAGDALYVGGDSGTVYALDAATGDERWRSTTDGPAAVSNRTVVVDETFYVGSRTAPFAVFALV